MRKYNMGLSFVFALVGGATIYFSKGLKTMEEGLGAGDWPRFLGIILVFLSAVMLIQAIIQMRKKPDSAEGDPEPPIRFRSIGMKRVYMVIAILIVFCLVLKWVGFYIACAFLLPLIMAVIGERRPLVLIVVTGGVILAIYIIFGLLLHTSLPHGTLFK